MMRWSDTLVVRLAQLSTVLLLVKLVSADSAQKARKKNYRQELGYSVSLTVISILIHGVYLYLMHSAATRVPLPTQAAQDMVLDYGRESNAKRLSRFNSEAVMKDGQKTREYDQMQWRERYITMMRDEWSRFRKEVMKLGIWTALWEYLTLPTYTMNDFVDHHVLEKVHELSEFHRQTQSSYQPRHSSTAHRRSLVRALSERTIESRRKQSDIISALTHMQRLNSVSTEDSSNTEVSGRGQETLDNLNMFLRVSFLLGGILATTLNFCFMVNLFLEFCIKCVVKIETGGWLGLFALLFIIQTFAFILRRHYEAVQLLWFNSGDSLRLRATFLWRFGICFFCIFFAFLEATTQTTSTDSVSDLRFYQLLLRNLLLSALVWIVGLLAIVMALNAYTLYMLMKFDHSLDDFSMFVNKQYSFVKRMKWYDVILAGKHSKSDDYHFIKRYFLLMILFVAMLFFIVGPFFKAEGRILVFLGIVLLFYYFSAWGRRWKWKASFLLWKGSKQRYNWYDYLQMCNNFGLPNGLSNEVLSENIFNFTLPPGYVHAYYDKSHNTGFSFYVQSAHSAVNSVLDTVKTKTVSKYKTSLMFNPSKVIDNIKSMAGSSMSLNQELIVVNSTSPKPSPIPAPTGLRIPGVSDTSVTSVDSTGARINITSVAGGAGTIENASDIKLSNNLSYNNPPSLKKKKSNSDKKIIIGMSIDQYELDDDDEDEEEEEESEATSQRSVSHRPVPKPPSRVPQMTSISEENEAGMDDDCEEKHGHNALPMINEMKNNDDDDEDEEGEEEKEGLPEWLSKFFVESVDLLNTEDGNTESYVSFKLQTVGFSWMHHWMYVKDPDTITDDFRVSTITRSTLECCSVFCVFLFLLIVLGLISLLSNERSVRSPFVETSLDAQYPACSITTGAKLSLLDLMWFAKMPYELDQKFNNPYERLYQMTEYWFGKDVWDTTFDQSSIMISRKTTPIFFTVDFWPDFFIPDDCYYYANNNNNNNVSIYNNRSECTPVNRTIVAVRGTEGLNEMIADVSLYSEVMVLQLVSSILPLTTILPLEFLRDWVYWAALPSKGLINPLVRKSFDMPVKSEVKQRFSEDQNRSFLLVGHSLGGSISQVVAARLASKNSDSNSFQSFSVSAPGTSYISRRFSFEVEALDKTAMHVLSRRDGVAMGDLHGGIVQHIECDAAASLGCHTWTRSFCELSKNCGWPLVRNLDMIECYCELGQPRDFSQCTGVDDLQDSEEEEKEE